MDSLIQSCQANGANDGSGYGGGIYVGGALMILRRSVLRGNSVSRARAAYYGYGGGVCNDGIVTIQNCLIATNNSTTDTGDGIYSTGTLTADGMTLVYNPGAGIYGAATLTNSILWGNGDDLTGPARVLFCDIQSADSFWTNGFNGCISTNPLFVDTMYYHEQSRDGNYTNGYFRDGGWGGSSVYSPCIDAGDRSSDFANEPAPKGGRINMGAYGNTEVASKSLGLGTILWAK
jgi:hypothetical protein